MLDAAGFIQIRKENPVDLKSHSLFHISFRLTHCCDFVGSNRQVCQLSKTQTASSVVPNRQHPSRTATQHTSGVCRTPLWHSDFVEDGIAGDSFHSDGELCPLNSHLLAIAPQNILLLRTNYQKSTDVTRRSNQKPCHVGLGGKKGTIFQ
jgi:hypothetical protein